MWVYGLVWAGSGNGKVRNLRTASSTFVSSALNSVLRLTLCYL